MSKVIVVSNEGISEQRVNNLGEAYNALSKAIGEFELESNLIELFKHKKFADMLKIYQQYPKLVNKHYEDRNVKVNLIGTACLEGDVELIMELFKIPGIDTSHGILGSEASLLDLVVQKGHTTAVRLLLFQGQKVATSGLRYLGLDELRAQEDWRGKMISIAKEMNSCYQDANKQFTNLCTFVDDLIKKGDVDKLFSFIIQVPGGMSWMIRERSESLNLQNEQGQTLCHYAAGNGKLDILQELIGTNKVDVHAVDIKGYGFMPYAKREQHNNIIDFLSNLEEKINITGEHTLGEDTL